MGEFVEVALPFNLPYPLIYDSPYPLHKVLGKRVLVPLKKRIVVGCVIGPGKKMLEARPIKHIVDKRPLLTEKDIEFAKWISRRYFYPLGLTLKHFFPPAFFIDTGGVFVYSGAEAKGELQEIASFSQRKSSVTKRELIRLFGKELTNRAIDEGILIPDPGPSLEKLRKVRVIYEAVPGIEPPGGKKGEIYRFLLDIGGAELGAIRKRFRVTSKYMEKMEKEGYVSRKEEEILYDGFRDFPLEDISVTLSSEQQKVVENILRGGRKHLIFGVTGSGKTFCFLEVAKKVVEGGGQVLIIVPEVGLTPQLLRRVEFCFKGMRLGLYHSYLTERERALTWFRAFDGEVDVVLGTRSSIFLPLRRLKLIIIDEEHDSSLQQDTGLRYDARELADYISETRDVKLIFSSATPSFETYYKAIKGDIALHRLTKRYGSVDMPKVEIVDLKKEGEKLPFLSPRLIDRMKENLEKGRQIIIFHTRRGYSPYAICADCGYTFKCVNCSLTLVYHKRDKTFRCHWCGYEEKGRDRCPKCNSYNIRFYGAGSERVEEEIKKIFPEVVIERLDSDSVRRKGRLTSILSRFHDGGIDILVGTNMVVKGHDFPRVGLVGVTGTDNVLNLPDYKAAERNFQLLAQVAGRSGRRERGDVLIQTYNPNHYSITCVLSHDFEGFFRKEMNFRKELGYPPFKDILLVVLKGKEKDVVKSFSHELREFLEENYPKLIRLGPFPAPVPRIKGFYRIMTILKDEKDRLVDIGWKLLDLKRPSSIEMDLYINPETLLV